MSSGSGNGKSKDEWKQTSNEFIGHADKLRDLGAPRDKDEKIQYLKLNDEIDEFKSAYDAKEKVIAGGKIAGKSLLNVKRFAFGAVLPAMFDNLAKKAKDNSK